MCAQWIPMEERHLSTVDDIALVVHPNYPERPEVMQDRLHVFAKGCFVAVADDGETMLGYTLSHPGVLLRPPPLDSLLERIPEGANCLYLHDVALLPTARGAGLGRALVSLLQEIAQNDGWPCLALTAVNELTRYWAGHGFQAVKPDATLAEKLASYDDDAAYMVRAVPAV